MKIKFILLFEKVHRKYGFLFVLYDTAKFVYFIMVITNIPHLKFIDVPFRSLYTYNINRDCILKMYPKNSYQFKNI
jgi:hypothetical protein